MLDVDLLAMDASVELGLVRDALEFRRALLVVVIRRFDCLRGDIPLHQSSREWHGFARRAFDESVHELACQLDRVRLILERAHGELVRALDDLAGRV